MPIDYRHYPAHWKAFSAEIRFGRAEARCECTGECGRDHAAENDQGYWGRDPRCLREHDPIRFWWPRVVLTTAHLCACKPKCAEPSHVKAMCQGCHLRLDLHKHMRRARQTRWLRSIAPGQMELSL